MLRLAADENFNNNIIRGLLRRQPDLDIVRVQDVGLSGADDPTVLEWAAQEGRVLLTTEKIRIISIFLGNFYHRLVGTACPHYAWITLIFLLFSVLIREIRG